MVWSLLLACVSSTGSADPPPGGDSSASELDDTAAPETTGSPCGDGEVLDGDTCVPEACGTGPWGSLEADVWVDPAADDGGDGTQSAPLNDLVDGIDAAASGDVVGLAAGTYYENLELTYTSGDLTIAGRCAELVTIDGSKGEEDAATVAFVIGSDGTATSSLTLDGLTITGAPERGLHSHGGLLTVQDCIVHGNVRQNVLVEYGGDLVLRDSVLHDPIPYAAEGGSRGHNIWFGDGGGHLVAENVELHDSRYTALYVYDATAELRDVLVDGVTEPGGEDWYSAAGLVVWGSEAVIENVTVRDAGMIAVSIEGDSSVTVDGLAVEDVRPMVHPSVGSEIAWGVNIYGGRVAGRDVQVTGVGHAGLISTEGGEVELSEVRVSELVALEGHDFGGATYAVTGDMVLSDLEVSSSAYGVTVIDGAMSLEGARVRDIGSGGDPWGVGMLIGERGVMTASDVVVERATSAGVSASIDSALQLTDAEISDTQLGGPWQSQQAAYGLTAIDGARVELEGVSFRGLRVAGIVANEAYGLGKPRVTLRDVLVEDVELATGFRTASGVFSAAATIIAEDLVVRDVAGPGVVASGWYAASSGSLSCERCEVSDVDLAGYALVGLVDGDTLELTDSTVDGVDFEQSSGLSIGVFVAESEAVPTLIAEGLTVAGVGHAALWAEGEVSAQVRDSTLVGGSGAEMSGWQVHGNVLHAAEGVQSWDGARGLLLEDNTFEAGAGEEVFLHADAALSLSGNVWPDGGELLQQGCSDFVPEVVGAEEAPIAEICPEYDSFVTDAPRAPMQITFLDEAL